MTEDEISSRLARSFDMLELYRAAYDAGDMQIAPVELCAQEAEILERLAGAEPESAILLRGLARRYRRFVQYLRAREAGKALHAARRLQ